MTGAPATTAPKPFVFVAMPFDPSFDDVYQLGIRAACHEAGGYCERVDEQVYDGTILDRILNQIARADVIVCELTGKNANVFYETGYAHALGKRTILAVRSVDEIPFDMKHFPHIVYGGDIAELKEQLVRRLTWAFQNLERDLSSALPTLEVFHQGRPLAGAEILHEPGTLPVELTFAVHNASRRVVERVPVTLIGARIARVVTPAAPGSWTRGVRLPGGEILHEVAVIDRMLPDAWTSLSLSVEPADDGEPRPARLRWYNEVQPVDVPFTLRASA